MARSRKVSRKKRSAKRKTSRKVAKRCPPGCVKKPMLLTDNGKIILGSTKAAKPKRKTSRKVSRKRRSVKRKVSRKKRSVKRKVSRKRRSVKRKSRKRKSAKRKASRKRKSAKRKASRKKTRNSPPSGVIKQQNLGVGSVMVGQDGKTMYKVVEITMRGKPVKKWAKMKFKMGQVFCGKDDAACEQLTHKQFKERWRPRLYDLTNQYQMSFFNMSKKNGEEFRKTLTASIDKILSEMHREAATLNKSVSWETPLLRRYEIYKKFVTTQRKDLIKQVDKTMTLDKARETYLRRLMKRYASGGHVTV